MGEMKGCLFSSQKPQKHTGMLGVAAWQGFNQGF